MQNVGPDPPGSSADSSARSPRRRNQEQPAPLPATQHPMLPVVAHTELLLTGEPPPPAHPLSEGSGGLPTPSACAHSYQLPLAPPLPHPPREVGPPPRGFRAVRQFSVKAPLFLTCVMAGRAAWPLTARDSDLGRSCDRVGGEAEPGSATWKGSETQRTRPPPSPPPILAFLGVETVYRAPAPSQALRKPPLTPQLCSVPPTIPEGRSRSLLTHEEN